jgi:predicted GH43/DUF377 family glycosyl hydrolase
MSAPTRPLAWVKQGLIFRPDPSKAWMQTHASIPTLLQLDGSLYRVYFASRDRDSRSHVGYVDIDLESPTEVVRVSPGAVLTPGPIGGFDGDGIYAESICRDGDELRLYTAGYTAGHTKPLFYAAIGLATSRDGGLTFVKRGRTPIMDVSEHDPCLVTAPFVMREGPLWRMWYSSCIGWSQDTGRLLSHYHVKYAESDDGVVWRREGRIAIDFAEPGETNIARLWIVRDGDRYRGWFSSGSASYRIRYAESHDGLTWVRSDPGITLSESGWDSEQQAYPAVTRHRDRWFMFYNGNSFGRDGIGLAIAPA